MRVRNFNIKPVCANKIEDGLYGDIYDCIEDCEKEHPNENIIFGFYAERTNNLLGEETPDWFYSIEEAVEWCKEND